jgi:protein ImuB
MPVAEARGLFPVSGSEVAGSLAGGAGSAEPHFECHDGRADERALQRLAQHCQQFAPRVGRDESGDALLLDISGCAGVFGGEAGLVERVQAVFGRWRLEARLGIADTVGAAWAAAHFVPAPEAVWIIPAGQQAERLSGLPVAALRLDASRLTTLAELDIRTIAQLQALPRASLAVRLGTHVVQQWGRLLGELPEPLQSIPWVPRAEAVQAWEYPLQQQEAVLLVLRRLLENVLAQLAPRQEGILRLQVELRGEGSASWCCELGLVRPAVSAGYLAELVGARWQRRPGRAATGWNQLAVRALATGRVRCRQGGLLDQDLQAVGQREFERLLEQLSTRLGESRVLRATLWPDAQPEFAFRCQPLIGSPPPAAASDSRPAAAVFCAARPLWLKTSPQPIQVLAAVSQGPPLRFRWHERDYVVRRSWGPERIATGWWRSAVVRRDYYRVETDRGQRLWLFREGTGEDREAWFVHGVFE